MCELYLRDEWNAANPIGCQVSYYPSFGRHLVAYNRYLETDDDATLRFVLDGFESILRTDTHTESRAKLRRGRPVIRLAGEIRLVPLCLVFRRRERFIRVNRRQRVGHWQRDVMDDLELDLAIRSLRLRDDAIDSIEIFDQRPEGCRV